MTQLVDQFEWDPSNPLNSPELFAKSLSRDLGLGPDYVVSIAVAIREKLLQAKQAMLDAPSVEQVVPILEPEELFRIADADEWGPALYTMTHRELEKKQTSEVGLAIILHIRKITGGELPQRKVHYRQF